MGAFEPIVHNHCMFVSVYHWARERPNETAGNPWEIVTIKNKNDRNKDKYF